MNQIKPRNTPTDWKTFMNFVRGRGYCSTLQEGARLYRIHKDYVEYSAMLDAFEWLKTADLTITETPAQGNNMQPEGPNQ